MKGRSSPVKGPLGQLAFWAFVLALLLIIGLSVFAEQLFSRYRSEHLTPSMMQAKVQASLVLVRTSLPEQYPYVVDLLRQRGMVVRIQKVAPLRAFTISGDQPVIAAMTQLKTMPHTSTIGIQLVDNQWLVLKVRSKLPSWLVESRVVATLLVMFMVFMLAYGVFFSFTVPLRLIRRATERLGTDMDAPRLAPVGTAAMRMLIRSFNAMQERLQKLLRDRSEVLAAVSHDLRTPITRLHLRAEFIEDKKQYKKTVEDLNDMERMIASILSFCKNYAEVESKSQLDLNALVASIVDDLEATGKAVTFTEQVTHALYFGRVITLRRAITNLIENAVKYGKSATVTLIEETDDAWLLSIVDEGPGIPDEHMGRVFEPFYRCDPARTPQVGGSGLGLAVVKEIIGVHNGRVVLINQPTGGLRVEVHLPKQEGAYSDQSA